MTDCIQSVQLSRGAARYAVALAQRAFLLHSNKPTVSLFIVMLAELAAWTTEHAGGLAIALYMYVMFKGAVLSQEKLKDVEVQLSNINRMIWEMRDGPNQSASDYESAKMIEDWASQFDWAEQDYIAKEERVMSLLRNFKVIRVMPVERKA